MNKSIKKRILEGALAVATALTLTCTALAAPPAVSTDEAVYVNLDYYGALADMRIVKGVSLNGETTFTDYGNYSKVCNMSTYDKPKIASDAVSWNLSVPDKQRFYYECIPSDNKTLQMPWTFDVSYKLDGIPIKAEKLSGAKGLVEITAHAIPNPNASAYYKNNMMLLVTTGIDMDKNNSIDAPGAQIQSFGSYKIVFFLGLPGEDNTYTIQISSDKFESTGLIMMMTPATMSQFDKISDFRDTKDKVSNASDDLYESINELLTTISGMNNSLTAMSAGITGLNKVRDQLIESRGTEDSDTDQSLAALKSLVEQMDSMVPELTQTQENLTKLQNNTNAILDTIAESQRDIEPYRKALDNLTASLNNVTDMLDDIANKTYRDDDVDRAHDSLSNALSSLSNASTAFSGTLDEMENGFNTLASSGLITDPAILALLQSGTVTDLLDHAKQLLSAVDSISGAGQSTLTLMDGYKNIIDDHSDHISNLTDSAAMLANQADSTLNSIDKVLDELPDLQDTMNSSVPVLNSILSKSAELLTSTKETLASANQTLTDLLNTLRSVRQQADDNTAQLIDGVLDIMQKAVNSSGITNNMQSANTSIYNAINDEIDDLEGSSNVLKIDNSLALQSFTSNKNPAPASLQFILRTKEISVDDQKEVQTQAQNQADEGAWQRIINVFNKIYNALASAFDNN